MKIGERLQRKITIDQCYIYLDEIEAEAQKSCEEMMQKNAADDNFCRDLKIFRRGKMIAIATMREKLCKF